MSSSKEVFESYFGAKEDEEKLDGLFVNKVEYPEDFLKEIKSIIAIIEKKSDSKASIVCDSILKELHEFKEGKRYSLSRSLNLIIIDSYLDDQDFRLIGKLTSKIVGYYRNIALVEGQKN